MIPYTRKNNSRQTIRTKSVCFGYKNFVLCCADDNPYHYWSILQCLILWRKSIKGPLCSISYYNVTEVDNWYDKEVFCDNWFPSLPLMTVLENQGIRVTRTVGTDRLGRNMWGRVLLPPIVLVWVKSWNWPRKA